MSFRALHASATGMDAQLFNLDTVANNMANAGTTGFKRSRVNFEDLFYEHLKLPGVQDSAGRLTPVGVSVGVGARVQSTDLDHGQGSLLETQQPYDMAIVGEGFFQIQDGSEILYTRAGNFTKNSNGEIVLASSDRGRLLEPAITIPDTAVEVSITSEGVISFRTQGSPDLTEVGQLQTVRFINPKGLLQVGENLFAATTASGDAQIGTPGTDGLGAIRSGFLEASNVEPVKELIDLIKTQRNVELNSQVVQASDQLLQLISNLRR